ncbi:unnamed protein product [Heterobilharzia americana]|nr:unnamed protein product [Heterobilharzia americana]
MPTDPTSNMNSTIACELNVVKRIQDLIIGYTGQNSTMIKTFLQKDDLEQKMHIFFATIIKRIDEVLDGQITIGVIATSEANATGNA